MISFSAQSGSQQEPRPGSDPEKRKLLQQQVILLWHAHQCQRRETQGDERAKTCALPYCQMMKDILRHVAYCQAGIMCTTPHCTSSKKLISHWEHCTNPQCHVCHPLKEDDEINNAGQVPNQQCSPPLQLQVLIRLVDGNSPQGSELNPTSHPQVDNILSLTGQMAQLEVSNAHVLREDINQQVTKKWHAQVNTSLREYLVEKLKQAVQPPHDLQGEVDVADQMQLLEMYARKVESDIFEVANSKSEYYHLLAEKYYKTYKQLDERLLERKQTMLQHQQQKNNNLKYYL